MTALVGHLRRMLGRTTHQPSVLGIWLNPFFLARRALWNDISAQARHFRGSVLDIGCGKKPYRTLFRGCEYIGLELDVPTHRNRSIADAYYDGRDLPFPANTCDGVVAFQVLEHVEDTVHFFSEIRRVLRARGLLLLTVPFVFDEHEQPMDFVRYTSFGLRKVLAENGFEIVDLRKSAPDVRVVFQVIQAYVYKTTLSRSPWINHLIWAILMPPWTIAGEVFRWLLPGNPDLYLNTVVLARRR